MSQFHTELRAAMSRKDSVSLEIPTSEAVRLWMQLQVAIIAAKDHKVALMDIGTTMQKLELAIVQQKPELATLFQMLRTGEGQDESYHTTE